MFALIVFILVLSILIIIHEFGHFIMAKRMGVRVEHFSLGFGPVLLTKKIKHTRYSICAIPLGGYVKLAGDNLEEFKNRPFEYLYKKPGERARIVIFGPVLNYIMAFLCFWLIFSLGYPTLTSQVGELLDDYPAQEAGIKPEDKIVAIDDNPVQYWEELQKIVFNKKQGQTVSLTILRNEQLHHIDVKIKMSEIEDIFGQKKNIGLIGISPSGEIVKVKYGLIKASMLGAEKLWDFTSLTLKAVFRIVTGKLSLKDSVTGPLGIFYVTSKAAQLGFIAVLHLVAVLNVSLAIFNLLPIPILDGGHLLLLGIEKIKGSYLSPTVDRLVSQLGLSFILLLAIIIFYNDLIRFGIWEKITQFLNR